MTHLEILLLIVGLLFSVGLAVAAFVLNEMLIDIREMKAMLEERLSDER